MKPQLLVAGDTENNVTMHLLPNIQSKYFGQKDITAKTECWRHRDSFRFLVHVLFLWAVSVLFL